jgi:hypothetical protein
MHLCWQEILIMCTALHWVRVYWLRWRLRREVPWTWR